jgi:hypothetical protein
MNDRRLWKRKRYIIPAAIIAAPVAIAVFVFVAGGVVMLLWNWLLPTLFGWPRITVWQGFGLVALCRILFGGFGKGGGGGYPSGKMSRKERERFQHRMRERMCGASEGPPRPEPNEMTAPTVNVSDAATHQTPTASPPHPEGQKP